MEKLFLKTENDKFQIEPEIIEKYHLEIGSISPFSRFHVTNQNGEENKDKWDEHDPSNQTFKPGNNEPVFTTSETIDIAQGVDSAVEGNKEDVTNHPVQER